MKNLKTKMLMIGGALLVLPIMSANAADIASTTYVDGAMNAVRTEIPSTSDIQTIAATAAGTAIATEIASPDGSIFLAIDDATGAVVSTAVSAAESAATTAADSAIATALDEGGAIANAIDVAAGEIETAAVSAAQSAATTAAGTAIANSIADTTTPGAIGTTIADALDGKQDTIAGAANYALVGDGAGGFTWRLIQDTYTPAP